MDNEKISSPAEDLVFESELIPSYGDMEMLLIQEGIRLNRHTKTYLSEIASLPALDADGAARLAARMETDPEAKSALIEGLMRIVVCAAVRYTGRGMTYLDLLQEGSLGLVGAAETYTPDDGDFRLHAAGCVLDALEFAAADAEMSGKIPEHLTELLGIISRSDMVLEEKLGREATPEEIAEHTGLALDEVLSVMELMEEIAAQDNGEPLPADEESDASGERADAENSRPRFDAGRHTGN